MIINKKDIILINQEIGEDGEFSNESSLDFALQIVKRKRSWLYELSYLVRSLLVDHVFTDGNKRTAFTLVIYYFNELEIECDKEKLKNNIYDIAKKNIIDINQIVRRIDHVVIGARKD